MKKNKTEEEIEYINNEAILFFNLLLEGIGNKDIFELRYYTESFPTAKYIKALNKEGKELNKHKVFKKYDKYFKEIFISKLRELAMESDYNIEIVLQYDIDKEKWYYLAQLQTKEYFENKYNYSLDEFYEILQKDNILRLRNSLH